MPSVMQRVGTPNARHNVDSKYRAQLDHVDPELTKYNEIIRYKTVEEIYAEKLQPAFEEFNERQKRKDRRLDVKWNCTDALGYQRAMDKAAQQSTNKIDQKGRPPIRELVLQIGNPEQGFGCKDQTPEQRNLAKEMLLEVQGEIEHRYPQLAFGDVVFHADEVSVDADDRVCGSFHLHSSFVPLCYQNKQGMSVQVAFERCLKEMGFSTFESWKHDLDQIMENVLERHGLERTVMGNDEKHVSYSEFHRQQAVIRETKELEKKAHEADLRLGAAIGMAKKYERAAVSNKEKAEKVMDEAYEERDRALSSRDSAIREKEEAEKRAAEAERKRAADEKQAAEAAQKAAEANRTAQMLQLERESLEGEIASLKAEKKELTTAEVESIKGEKTLLGGLKGVTYKEFEALKETAAKVDAITAERDQALEKVEIARKNVEAAEKMAKDAIVDVNRQLKAKIKEVEQERPSLKAQLEIAGLKSENQRLLQENNQLKEQVNWLTKVKEALLSIIKEKLPEVYQGLFRKKEQEKEKQPEIRKKKSHDMER